MANVGIAWVQTLRTALTEPLEARLRFARQAVNDFDRLPQEASNRTCTALRAVLKSIRADPAASAQQVHDASTLQRRVRAFDPRHADQQEEVTPPRYSTTQDPAAPEGELDLEEQMALLRS